MLTITDTKFVPLTILITVLACAKPGTRSPANHTTEANRDLSLSKNGGSIAVSLSGEAGVDSISGYVVGNPIVQRLDTPNISKLSLMFTDLPPASYDIVIQGSTGQIVKGVRINGIKVVSDQTSRVNLESLPPVRSLSGSVTDIEGKGIEATVRILGTDFETKSDASGGYSLKDVPQGKHELLFTADGFIDGTITGIHLTKSGSQEQGQMILRAKDDDSSTFAAAVKDAKASVLKVPFALIAPADANQVRLSENDDFKDAKWVPFSSIVFFEFKEPGEKKLFAQFSKNGGSLSEVVFTEVSISLP